MVVPCFWCSSLGPAEAHLVKTIIAIVHTTTPITTLLIDTVPVSGDANRTGSSYLRRIQITEYVGVSGRVYLNDVERITRVPSPLCCAAKLNVSGKWLFRPLRKLVGAWGRQNPTTALLSVLPLLCGKYGIMGCCWGKPGYESVREDTESVPSSSRPMLENLVGERTTKYGGYVFEEREFASFHAFSLHI